MNQHDRQIEEDVIGALILYPEKLIAVHAILKAEYLYLNETKAVYKSILNLYGENLPVDIGTVVNELKKQSQLEMVGGSYYVSSIARAGDLTEKSLEFNCLLIHEMYILRELSVLGQEIINSTGTANADCFEIVDRVNKRTAELTNIRSEKIKTVGDYFYQLVDENDKVLTHGKPTGIMSGLENLDCRTGGWQNGNLIIIAARPGMGKTAIALHLALNPAITSKIPVAIFSLEMTALELTGRMASSESQIDSTQINQKKLNRYDLQDMAAKCTKLIDAPVYIDDTPGLNITELRAKAKKLFYEYGVKLIIVDYLQKMQGNKKGNKEQEISDISNGLKNLARELNIPVIALAQLNRTVEDRPDKRPMLRDLRDSGSIEQDADIVGFLFRPEYYDLFPNGYEFRNELLPTPNLMLFDIAKGRGLKLREIPLKFYGEFMQIKDYPLMGEITANSPLDANYNFLND